MTPLPDHNRAEGAGDNKAQATYRVIKKYPNRRLYDTRTSSYVTLQEIKDMVVNAEHIKVIDAKSNEDLTRGIFLQIILEEEAGGLPLFSEVALANIIRFYGHSMQGLMGAYLENNIQQFLDMQLQLSQQAQHMSPERWAQLLANPVTGSTSLLTDISKQSNQFLTHMQAQMLKIMGLKR